MSNTPKTMSGKLEMYLRPYRTSIGPSKNKSNILPPFSPLYPFQQKSDIFNTIDVFVRRPNHPPHLHQLRTYFMHARYDDIGFLKDIGKNPIDASVESSAEVLCKKKVL